jgi:disulfide bond formation protein DsbB
MHQGLAMKRTAGHRLGGATAAQAALALFVVSLGALLGAWYFQYVVGLAPCPLCLDQRIPYYIIIPLSLLLAIAARARVPRWLAGTGFAVILMAALCGAALGAYHAGVEWRFWPGPADCSGPLADLRSGGSLLDQLNGVHVVRCDEAAWRFLGISLAGYNVLVSLAMAAMAACGLSALRGRPVSQPV